MSAKSEFRRARRREREQAAALPPHPVREAEERVARAADDRARFTRTPDTTETIRLPEVWAVPLDGKPNGACVMMTGKERRVELARRRHAHALAEEAAEPVRARWRQAAKECEDEEAKARVRTLKAEMLPLAAAVKRTRTELVRVAFYAQKLHDARQIERVIKRGVEMPCAPRDPLPLLAATTTQRMAGDFYRWAWHATRSTVVAAPIHQGTAIRGEPIPPQEIAMEALAALRLCERAVPEPIRTRWLDPVVVDYRTATSVAEQRSREGGHHVPPQAVTAMVRESLDLLHPARVEWERLEAEGKRARRRERDWAA